MHGSVAFTVNTDDIVDSENTLKGHRGLHDSFGAAHAHVVAVDAVLWQCMLPQMDHPEISSNQLIL